MAEQRHERLLDVDEAGLKLAGKLIQDGKLVSFPTETVYGLGANALDENSVLSIFKAKGRPLSDPVIVHVLSLESALEQNLVNLSHRDKEIASYLAEKLWPGPITLVLKANDELISPKVTASTGLVGIRVPSHPVARKLLETSGRPIAAPSANRFGHVSPTSPQHVLDDLGDKANVYVLDGGDCHSGACGVGIESTVLQVHGCRGDQPEGTDKLVLFRKGGVSEQRLMQVLHEGGFAGSLEIEVPGKAVKHEGPVPGAGEPSPEGAEGTQEETEEGTQEEDGLAAPGQLLTHYAPDVDTRLVVPPGVQLSKYPRIQAADEGNNLKPPALATSVVIDFGGALSDLKSKVLAYKDLSESGSTSEAARALFDALRWSEKQEGATNVLLADVMVGGDAEGKGEKLEHREAVADRMFRAASGKRIAFEKLVE